MLKTYMTLYSNDIYCALKMFIFLQIKKSKEMIVVLGVSIT